jgi:hypothetical protein
MVNPILQTLTGIRGVPRVPLVSWNPILQTLTGIRGVPRVPLVSWDYVTPARMAPGSPANRVSWVSRVSWGEHSPLLAHPAHPAHPARATPPERQGEKQEAETCYLHSIL